MADPTSSPQAVVDAYVTGTRTRDVALLQAIFHKEAVMSGWTGPDLLVGGPEPFYDALQNNEVGADYTAEITQLEQMDKIAVATLKEQNLLGLSFTNLFHLIQIADGSWRITSKIFRHY